MDQATAKELLLVDYPNITDEEVERIYTSIKSVVNLLLTKLLEKQS